MTLKERWQAFMGKSAPAPTTTSTLLGNRYPVPMRSAFMELYKSAYVDNSVSAACIGVRSSTLSEAPLVAVTKDGDKNPNHPIATLFRRPNKQMSGSDLIALISQYLDIGGNCYVYKVRSVAGTVMELWPYSDALVAPIIDDVGQVSGYYYRSGNVQHTWRAEDVLHLRNTMYIDPTKPYMGVATAAKASAAIEILNELESTVYTLAKDNAVPMGVLSATQEMTPTQQEYLKNRLRDRSRRGEPLILGNMTWSPMGLTMQQLDIGVVRTQLESQICGVFRVDPRVAMTYAGLSSSTYANQETAFREYTTLTRIPWWNAIEEQLQTGFMAEYPDVTLEFDTSVVAALASDPDAIIYPTIAAFNGNLITQNEARNALAQPPLEDGDKFSFELVPAPTFGAFSALAGGGDDAIDEVVEEPDGTKRVRWNNEKAQAYWQAQNEAVKSAEEAYAKATEDMFLQAEKQVLGTSKGVKRVDPTLNLQQLYTQWMAATGKAREALFQRMIELSVSSVNGDMTLVVSEIDRLRQRSEREVTSKINEALGQTQKDVSAVLDANAGKPEAEVRAALKDAFKTMSSGRTTAIARTTARAQSTRTLKDSWTTIDQRETDPKRKLKMVWLTRRDDAVRPEHEDMDGKVVGIGESFRLPNGDVMEGPGVGGSASNAINCRCVIRAVRAGRL